MKKIFKYVLKTTDVQSVEMPKGAEILSIQTQNDDPCIWALVDPEQEMEYRIFRIFGTGHDVMGDDTLNYIGTYQQYGGSLVFHCFEVK
jgi:hypothetical protein